MYKTARNLSVLGLGLSISAIVGWLLLREKKREKETVSVTVKSETHCAARDEMPQIVLPLETREGEDRLDAPVSDIAAPSASDPDTARGVDNFTQINGIGPRFADSLQAIGITRFAQLAALTPEALSEQLAPHVKVSAQRIRDHDWLGQATKLTQNQVP